MYTRRIRAVIRQHGNCTLDISLPCAYIERKTGVGIMSDTYFDLPSRMEDSFPEINSDDCSFVNGIKVLTRLSFVSTIQ